GGILRRMDADHAAGTKSRGEDSRVARASAARGTRSSYRPRVDLLRAAEEGGPRGAGGGGCVARDLRVAVGVEGSRAATSRRVRGGHPVGESRDYRPEPASAGRASA